MHPGTDLVSTGANGEGWNQLGRRLIVGTAILNRRNFAHSLRHGFPLRFYAGGKGNGVEQSARGQVGGRAV